MHWRLFFINLLLFASFSAFAITMVSIFENSLQPMYRIPSVWCTFNLFGLSEIRCQVRFAITQNESCIAMVLFYLRTILHDITSYCRQNQLFFFCFFKEHLINLLENGIERLRRAERYEVMGTVYKLAVPLYEEDRDFSVSFYCRLANKSLMYQSEILLPRNDSLIRVLLSRTFAMFKTHINNANSECWFYLTC